LFFTLENDFFLKISEKNCTLTGEKGLGRVKDLKDLFLFLRENTHF
jgi:hypothetical protein